MADKESQPEEMSEKYSMEPSSEPDEGKIGYFITKTWPEVVGLTAEEAERKIKAEMPSGSHIYVIPPGSILTMECRMDRVRIFIDSSGKVSKPPRIG